MEDSKGSAEIATGTASQSNEADSSKAAQEAVEAKPNLPMALLGGAVTALIGAVIWATVTVVTGYKLGLVAVAIGFLVGFAVRTLGKGNAIIFGAIGAAFALIGCVLGNFLSACALLSTAQSISITAALLSAITNPSLAVELFTVTFSPMDLLFYGFAIYEGYKFSLYKAT